MNAAPEVAAHGFINGQQLGIGGGGLHGGQIGAAPSERTSAKAFSWLNSSSTA
ncbi:MAG: hypothetical protein R2911_23310 [Caldilineaceae bacterium]